MKAAHIGHPYPLGAIPEHGGVNFALFAEHAEHVDLVLFDDLGHESDVYELIDVEEFTWNGFIPGLAAGQRYGYRVQGKYDPARGLRYNPHKLLLDPYAKAIAGQIKWGPEVFGYSWPEKRGDDPDDRAMSELDSTAAMPQSVVVDDGFDWQGDQHPNIAWADTIIYETHVGGFTMRNRDVPENLRGTYAGLANQPALDYLRDLGITAVELMPVHQFVDHPHLLDRGLRNYWGYDTLGYFAPDSRYSASGDCGNQVSEFKGMVKALHGVGLEVILDVVYNHTAEGNHLGPTLSLRGIDNQAYYKLTEDDQRFYWDVTGCGNTLNVSHPQSLQLIMDSLRYWVTEMHVDGFRFDLASALARQFYEVDRLSAFFDIVHQDPILGHTKLIAEPWDVGPGGYQVGNFPVRWAEWNAKYRDTVRDYWRGQTVGVGDLAYRLAGSSDLYAANGRAPSASINFVTAHDGFTLRDLVSYNNKHNDANGESNRDGADDNRSWNCGAEGETDNAEVLALRSRQQRNFLATILMSQGSPMIVSGDEISRTQGGNNNPYCQNNEISWLDWDSMDRPLLEFTKRMIQLRRSQPVLRRRHFFQGQIGAGHRRKDLIWLRGDGDEMQDGDWNNGAHMAVGMLLNGQMIPERAPDGTPLRSDSLLALLNSHHEPVNWTLPSEFDKLWAVAIDTARPDEPEGERRFEAGSEIVLEPRSMVVLLATAD